MAISLRFLSHKVLQNFSIVKLLGKDVKPFSSVVQAKLEVKDETVTSKKKTSKDKITSSKKQENDNIEKKSDEAIVNTETFTNFRFIYPEFLPTTNPLYRNPIREKLERTDMLARRSVLNIPEFYVGSILAVTYSEPHATAKTNRFVGICILREGIGLYSSITLRNVVQGEGVEVIYHLYDPAIQKIDCLRLEKRLDDELLYLRDAPLEYSTFPFDMDAELTPQGAVPINETIVPLNPSPWLQKWEQKNMKGITNVIVNEKRAKKAKANAKPWEKYDLMKMYRASIPEEEQIEIFADIEKDLCQLEVRKKILKRQRQLRRPKRVV